MTVHRELLERLYDVAVAAAHPRALVHDAIDRLREVHPDARRVGIISLGKAAPAMTVVAVERLAHVGATIVGGITVGAEEGQAAHRELTRLAGDHPSPGGRSHRAATALESTVGRIVAEADVALVLVSGGATSLVGAPVEGVTHEELAALYDALLRSGWDIAAMNDVRKRFLRWGAGRLAMALAPIRVQLALLSDVIGDDPRTIASGPCTPDPLTAADIAHRIDALATLDSATRTALTDGLRRVARGTRPESPKPGHAAFRTVSPPIIHGNATALEAVAAFAHAAGWPVMRSTEPMQGEAREIGAAIATSLLAAADRGPVCVIHGGETTVTIASAAPTGGRCQELALAAAQVLAGAGTRASPVALLAAGTDGRDGPTDAAGAIVDGDSWRRIRDAGIEPEIALAAHASNRALSAAGALLPRRTTGTNVMDIVIGLAGRATR